MIIAHFTSVKIRIVAVTFLCKQSLSMADMPLRKTNLKIEKPCEICYLVSQVY